MLIWKVQSENLNIASLRYRCLIPVKYLKDKKYKSLIVSNEDKIDFYLKIEAIIFIKSFTKQDLKLAQIARQKNIPIILDICDNIFAEGYAAHSKSNPANFFKEMAKIADAIVTTGTALKSCIKSCIDSSIPIFIVPDASETIVEFQSYDNLLVENQKFKNRVLQQAKIIILLRKPKAAISYLKSYVKRKLIENKSEKHTVKRGKAINISKNLTDKCTQKPQLIQVSSSNNQNLFSSFSRQTIIDKYRSQSNELKQVIWFGLHGIKFGQKLFKLLDISAELIKAYQQINFCLHIVSEAEAYAVYQQYIQSLPLPTKFTIWNQHVNYQSISQSHVTIIPNSLDAFEICKSPNRAILSLALGVPVIATKTPALLPFENCLIFDDWQSGIISYLKDPDLVFNHITKAQSIIKRDYSGEVIADQWAQIIDIIGRKS